MARNFYHIMTSENKKIGPTFTNKRHAEQALREYLQLQSVPKEKWKQYRIDSVAATIQERK